MTIKRILITGAAGAVASHLIPALAGNSILRLSDMAGCRRVEAGDGIAGEWVDGDLTDADVAVEAVRDVDAVVHLAGNGDPLATFDQLDQPNFRAASTVMDAASRAGVRRLIFASSVHAMGRYDMIGPTPISSGWPQAPCCEYGASKVYGEVLGRIYADRTDMRVIVLRLGAVVERPRSVGGASRWLAPDDLQLLVRSALAADVRYGVYHAVSASPDQRWDIRNAQDELGYIPTRNVEEFSSSLHADNRPMPHGPLDLSDVSSAS